MYEWSLVAECDAVLEIRDDNRVSGKKKFNKGTEIRKTIKDSDKIGIF